MELKELAIEEAVKLKKYAPAKALKGITPARIINEGLYGVIAGFIYNSIALKLIRRCGVPYSDRTAYVTAENNGFSVANERAFSALEFYVATPDANIINLCEYLTGKTDNLNL